VSLVFAWSRALRSPHTPLAVVDPAGKVGLANREAAVLLCTPADTPAYAAAHRWTPAVPALPQLARRVAERARQDPRWSGSTSYSTRHRYQDMRISGRTPWTVSAPAAKRSRASATRSRPSPPKPVPLVAGAEPFVRFFAPFIPFPLGGRGEESQDR